MSFSQFKKERLCNISEVITRGVTPSYTEEEGVIVINQKCIRDNRVDLSLGRLTDVKKKKIPDHKYLNRYDILINSTGVGTLGRVAQIKEINQPITVDSHVTIVRPNNIVDPRFLGYNLFMQQSNIERLAEGSTGQTELSRVRLGEIIEVVLPPLNEQKAIVHILSTLDKKVEVNNQINKTLEVMAQGIFKQWFVDFEFPNENGEPYKSSGGEMVASELGMIPKAWEVKSLEESCDEIVRGFTSKYIEKGKIKNLNQKVNKGEFLEKQYFKYLREDIEIPENKYARKYDILLNSLGQGTLGRIHFYVEGEQNIVVDQHITIIRPNNEIAKDSYVYQLLITSAYKGIVDNLITGFTGMLMLNISKVRELKMALPQLDLQENYNIIVKSLYDEKALFLKENEILKNIRDALLSRLMSGETRIMIDN
ncbi:restriction endonuclease subunit S [Clostridium estertheticum]|uniref:Type I restriction modification DNA specificity domain-containing protein n=1 Tax=Clostridium estertheticum subsp. estertheticum TaxID=1552 RepID=A0A1J0GF26_9CLOT|nr:restriction endonuclease subunit S [Clostridium estertheticum]APC39980.1 hypothetical protein A7L45_07830 [Clostridium estertheticum subsp. estertheticum]MBZ9613938.1 restriction endonuclease subunit S [Clostridium estertheticum subsp. laramiense]WAG73899.1 restriction endonuclease subunit S [Clostridium estertheticum]